MTIVPRPTSGIRMHRALGHPLPASAKPEGFTIRTLRPGEEKDWVRLKNVAFGEEGGKPWTVDNFHDTFTRDACCDYNRIFVALKRDAIVATASAWEAHYGDGPVGLIHWVGTDPKYRGRGLGYALTLRALKELVARGYADAYLNTSHSREPAVRLYKRLGFRILEPPMNTPIRILLVGCGRMALSHASGLKPLPELGLIVAGVDPSKDARKNLEIEYGVSTTYDNLDDALAHVKADAAIIAVPNFLHQNYTIACLKKGLHTLVEKPMALNLADVDDMIATAKDKGKLLMCGQSQRFSPAIRQVKKMLEENAVGKIRHIIHRRLGSGRGGDAQSWFARQELSGGILPGIGVHSLDILLWWLNEKAVSVSAIAQNIDPHPEVDIEDEVSLIATTESRAILNCALSFHHRGGTDWLVMGDRGSLHLSGTQGPLLLNGEEQAIPATVHLDGEPDIHLEFLTAIRNNRALAQASAQDVRKTMALIFAAMESGKTGKTTPVPP